MLAAMSQNPNGSQLGSIYGTAVSYDFASMRYPEGDVVHAASCVLYYCVRGYQSIVNDPNLVEKITETWSDPNVSHVLGDVYHEWNDISELIRSGYDVVLTAGPFSDLGLKLSKPTNFATNMGNLISALSITEKDWVITTWISKREEKPRTCVKGDCSRLRIAWK